MIVSWTLPVVLYLNHVKSGARFSVLGDGTMLSVARLSGLFEDYFPFENAQFSVLFSENEPSAFLRSFFSRFDEVYFFTAGNRCQIERFLLRSGAGRCFTLNPKQPDGWLDKHIVLHYLSILPGINTLCLSDFSPFLPHFSETRKTTADLVIHPGSGNLDKNWPPEKYGYVTDTYKGNVKVILGPAEIERGFSSHFRGKKFEIVTPETIRDLYDVVSGAALYLGNDSGVSHLAGACGIPGVVLFGATSPVVWRPPYTTIRVIQSNDGTMDGISVEEVLETLHSVGKTVQRKR